MVTWDREENEAFEDEVRRVARLLWPSAEYSGSRMEDGHEYDGVFETEDCVHLVEATTSRKQAKAHQDIRKLIALAEKFQKRNAAKAVKCWFVTKDEPTADQRGEIPKANVNLVYPVSFAGFQAKLIDSCTYLATRESHSFGSVRDPESGNQLPGVDYVPLDMVEVRSKTVRTVNDVLVGVGAGKQFVILGDYGAGKSMTLRHLYGELRRQHLVKKSPQFPVYLNLREHYGQTDPAEVLDRHARNIGFANASHLVRAWKAGFVIMLIDGFDEIAAMGIQGLWRKLQDNRYRAMEIVRKFVIDHPPNVGMVLAGRAHFFDNDNERQNALGLQGRFIELSLNEFTADQVESYLKKFGLSGKVPAWVPSRPLLIGYLASRGLLNEIGTGGSTRAGVNEPARGWDHLLDRTCQRESEIEVGLDGPTVRRILERLASKGRSRQGGVGPFSSEDILQAFHDVCGYQPNEKGMVLLQRLPGIGIDRADEETRSFIDHDFADACRAGDLVRFVEEMHGFEIGVFEEAEVCAGSIGVSIGAEQLSAKPVSEKQINAAIDYAQEVYDEPVVLCDLTRIGIEMGYGIENHIRIKGATVPGIDFSGQSGDCSRLVFEDCYFERVGLDEDAVPGRLPKFISCYIGAIEGRISGADLPAGIFDNDCLIDNYPDGAETTDGILGLSLPLGTKVLLTVLKKLYFQRGRGRRANAFYRGLDHRGRRLVPKVLTLLHNEGLAIPYRSRDVWLPERGSMKRVGTMLNSPTDSNDPVIVRSKDID